MKKQKQKKHRLDIEVDLRKFENYHYVPNLPNVFFPYEPYPEQIDIVASIQTAIKRGENALIQSPTGTGKTLCLLVGALSSLVDSSSRKKIFYLTRTHSQISQVVSEFKKTSYRCHMNIIASRQHLCINHNLQQLKGKVLEKACQQLCFQKLCAYKQIGTVKIPRQAMDLQQFKDSSRRELACPYFYSKQLIQKCQLTILPFNYLLDWNLFQRASIDIKDSVIIFDQAHNIDTLCEQGSDIRLTVDLLFQSLAELRALMKAQSKKFLHQQFREGEDCQQTEQFKEQIELLLSRIKSGTEVSTFSKQQLLHLLEDSTTTVKQQGVDLGNYGLFVSRGKRIIRMFQKKVLHCQSFQLFIVIFQKCYDILNNSQSFDKFSVSLTKTELLFRCVDPSLCFKKIGECKPRSIILSSGTLGDLNIWENNLKIPFPHKINTESFITDRQLYAQIRVKSQNGTTFNFSFQGKQNQKQFEEIGRDLKRLESIIVGGIVVAFSTYQLLEKTLKYCSILQKKIFYETKGGSVDDIYSAYQKEVKQLTAYLFIVIKGRFSQGINFSGQLCRCLIVIGIPFLPLRDPGVVEKMRYLQSNHTKAQAEEWYTMQSFKGLNQTLGRAIRNKHDYAVILLFDQRYTKEQYIKNMSTWFSRCLRPIKNEFQDVKKFLEGGSWKNVEVKTENKYSTKYKKQLTICQRLEDFSTPNKSLKNKKKLKLVMQTEIKQETSKKATSKADNSLQAKAQSFMPKQQKSRIKTEIKLTEIKVFEDQQPSYKQMKKQLQDYFLNFSASTEKDQQATTTQNKSSQVQLQQTNSIGDENTGKVIRIMRSYGKCTNILDF